MARIARRGLRIKALPLFSLGEPWQSVCDSSGVLGLRLFEPRYLELARRVFPPAGDGKFGYAEAYPPEAGSTGVLAKIEQFRWESGSRPEGIGGNEPQDIAMLSARAARRFRVLAVSKEEIAPSKPPLFVAHVQLLEDRDVARGSGAEAWNYWMHRSAHDGESKAVHSSQADDPGMLRAKTVKAGTALVAKLGAPVFESPESWHAVAQVPAGIAVIAAGEPRVVEGYLMVPIVPSGAVELTLFREMSPDGQASMPSEAELRSTLLKLGEAAPESAAGEEGAGRKHTHRGRRR